MFCCVLFVDEVKWDVQFRDAADDVWEDQDGGGERWSVGSLSSKQHRKQSAAYQWCNDPSVEVAMWINEIQLVAGVEARKALNMNDNKN